MSDTFTFEDDEPKSQTGQFIAAGVLGLLLVVLNVWPDGKKKSEVPYTPPSAVAQAESTATDKSERKIVWPESLITDVIRTNPFQMNKDLAEALNSVKDTDDDSATDGDKSPEQTLTQQNATAATELDASNYPVKFVFSGPRGKAAMIKNTVYHEGDEIDGMLIVRIAETGVILRPAPIRPAAN